MRDQSTYSQEQQEPSWADIPTKAAITGIIPTGFIFDLCEPSRAGRLR
jgi:hypothetical protein